MCSEAGKRDPGLVHVEELAVAVERRRQQMVPVITRLAADATANVLAGLLQDAGRELGRSGGRLQDTLERGTTATGGPSWT